jgi:hypothetical protein
LGGVEGEVRGYLGPYAEGLVAGCLRRGFAVAVGDGFCNFAVLLALTGGFGGLPEAPELPGDLVWYAGFAVACARKGSGIHGILLEGVRRAYGACADVDIIMTGRSDPNACDSYLYKLKPGSDPETAAREAVGGSLEQMVRYVMEEAEGMRVEGLCRSRRECARMAVELRSRQR